MSVERAYYFVELLKLIWPPLPIAITLAATVLLHRRTHSRYTFAMVVTTVAWLASAVGSRFMFSLALPLSSVTTNSAEAVHTNQELYLNISSALFLAEVALFTAFAVMLLLLFRSHLGGVPRDDI